MSDAQHAARRQAARTAAQLLRQALSDQGLWMHLAPSERQVMREEHVALLLELERRWKGVRER